MKKEFFIMGIAGLVLGASLGYYAGAPKKSPTAISLHGTMTDMNAALHGKTGDDFDKAFLSEMIIHHEGAVSMAEAALENAKHQEIKDLASAIISAQNKEIAEMRDWQKNWYTR